MDQTWRGSITITLAIGSGTLALEYFLAPKSKKFSNVPIVSDSALNIIETWLGIIDVICRSSGTNFIILKLNYS